MSDRKAELEKKKAKLAAIREEKKRKEEEKKRKEAEAPSAIPGGRTQGQGDLRAQTDKLLDELGLPPAASDSSTTSGTVSHVPATAAAPPPSASTADQTQSQAQQLAFTKKKVQLSASKITQTNIAPREMVTYSKETQTHAEPLDRDAASSTASTTPSLGQSPQHQHYAGNQKFVFPNLEWDDEFSQDDDTDSLDVAVDTPPVSAHSHKMPHPEMARPAQTLEDLVQMPPEEVLPPARELSEEEKTQIMTSADFQHFMERSSRVIERALSEQVDIFADYTGEEGDDHEGGLTEGEKLKLNRQFFEERWSKHRILTCLDWSTQYPELLLASYSNNEESPHDPDGVALIWNIKYKKSTPEYVFHCQSAVMSSCFAKFHPNLIVGGTYSGQIVLWDNRNNKRTPVQRTPLSAAAHTHPVYCVNVVGTQNAHNLISVSTDGKMCSWNLDMLSQPQDSIELQHKQTKAVAVTSFSFLSSDVNNFVVGSEEGLVYTACRHGSKAGITDMFDGHHGPVTGLDCHTVPGQIDFSPYFITSSFDWTVKLWNIKENRPLHSFEDNSDYVYDAKWSPIHPALFATVDGMGRLDLWNLNNDTEIPTATTVVEGGVALNKCRWHQSGHQIAAGDDLGKIHIYDVGEPLAVPRTDEWSKFVHTLQELKNNQAEQDEEKASFMSLPLR